MNPARTVGRELLGLVVEDWSLALAILAWLAAIWLVAPRLGLEGAGRCVALFLGLGLILAGSSWREARRQRRGAAAR
ncbi:MAG: hypothetical protein ACREFU_09750 [Acetobacteraceae bacterium]